MTSQEWEGTKDNDAKVARFIRYVYQILCLDV